MIYTIDIKINQFVLLLDKPFSWQVLVSKSVGLIKGDRIRYREVDNSLVPTGRDLIGIILWLGSGDMIVNNNTSVFAYCYNVSQGLGSAKIGESFIIV